VRLGLPLRFSFLPPILDAKNPAHAVDHTSGGQDTNQLNTTRDLKSRKVQQLGELVIATGADTLTPDELAGALIVLAETKDTGKREAWAKRGAAFFQGRSRRTAPATDRNAGGASAQPGGAQPASGRKGAT
jgi:Conjugal transfer protein TraD